MPEIEINKLSMHYETHGRGRPLLLLHGLGQTGESWRETAEFFSREFRVIVPDLRGHRRSIAPNSEVSSSLAAGDIVILLDVLNLDEALVWGYSFGGSVVFRMLANGRSNFRACVIESCALEASPKLRIDLIKAGYREIALELNKAFIGKEQMRNVKTPCLLIFGDRDPYFPIDVICETYAKLPKSELLLLPNIGHDPRRSYQDLINKVVFSFLKGRFDII